MSMRLYPFVKQKHLQYCCFDKNNVFLLFFGWGAKNCIAYIFLFILFIGVLKTILHPVNKGEK